MTPYIVNLTNHLINVNHYDEIWKLVGNEKRFVNQVTLGLSVDEVARMSPQTLGKIMVSLEVDDVMASKEELVASIHFNGSPGEMLRDLVSSCLAYAIAGRLHDERMDSVPPFLRRTVGV